MAKTAKRKYLFAEEQLTNVRDEYITLGGLAEAITDEYVKTGVLSVGALLYIEKRLSDRANELTILIDAYSDSERPF